MADYGITAEGFKVKPREAILADTNARFIATFGTTFDVTPSSPDGQVIGIVADLLYASWLREEAVFNTFIPSKAYGSGLDDLVALNGIRRIENQPTTVLCTLGGTAGVLVPQGSIVETVEGLQFKTNTPVILPNDVTVTCLTLGAIPVGAGEVTVINADNPIAAWTSVNNTEAGVLGIVRQTDPELRALRNNSTISRGVHTVDAIYQSISNLNLTHIYVDNNDTDATVDGVPARTIHVIVEGGNRQEIAQAIFNNLPVGVPTYGSITEQVADIKGHLHDIKMDRPLDVLVEVSAELTIGVGAPYNTAELVQAAIVDHINTLGIGVDVVWSSLFAPILAIPYVTVNSLTTALDGGVHATTTLTINNKSRALTDLINVVVT